MSSEGETLTEDEFEQVLYDGIAQCREAGYNPTAFRMMIKRHGGIGAVKRLLAPPVEGISEGFTRLLLIGHPELAVEYVVAHDRRCWKLFTNQELEIARARLKLYELKVP